jgi:hypothetical protein
MTHPSELDALLDEVGAADRLDRIEYRDRVAAYGADALRAMAEWVDDQELSRFAIRVIEQIGRQDGLLGVAVSALSMAHSEASTPDIARDIEETLGRLGKRLVKVAKRGPTRGSAPTGLPGVPGRRYWAFRTSSRYPEFIWAEVRRGRLRQGWGYLPKQDLRLLAERKRAGVSVSLEENAAWRARRMLTTESDGIRVGDLVVTQNLPRHGHLSVCRVIGPYDFAIPDNPQDFGHILPVELIVEDVNRGAPAVSDALRHAISLQPRLYEITPYGGDVDALVTGRTASIS